MDSERARLVFYASILVIGGIAFWLYASSPDESGRARWQTWRLWRGLAALFDAGNERRPLVRFVRAAGEDMSSISNTAADDYVAEPVRMAQTDSRQAVCLPVSEPHKAPAHLQLNKTRTAVIEELLTHGWNVGEIRSVVKGDNGTIGAEIDAARQRLGIEAEARTVPVRVRGQDDHKLELDAA